MSTVRRTNTTVDPALARVIRETGHAGFMAVTDLHAGVVC